MDPAEQTDEQKKFKRPNVIVSIVKLGLVIIGIIALLGIVAIGSIWCGVAVSNSGRPEAGELPCKEDWDPLQLNAEIEDDPYQYIGQCFEFEGTVDFSERSPSSNKLHVRSDTGGHFYIFDFETEDMPPCVMGNIAEGSRVSASAYLREFPGIRDGRSFYVLFGCAIPDDVDRVIRNPLRDRGE